MEEACVYLKKTRKAITLTMLLLLLTKRKSLLTDCGWLLDRLKMKVVNMITESKNSMPLSWEELGSELEILDVTTT